MSVENTLASFEKAYPDDSIIVYKFKTGGYCSYFGEILLDIQTKDGYVFRVYKLSNSLGQDITDEDIKVKAFPFVYDTKNVRDGEQRRDILESKLEKMFPDHHVNIFIFNDSNWSRQAMNIKGMTHFEKTYGSEVDIILN